MLKSQGQVCPLTHPSSSSPTPKYRSIHFPITPTTPTSSSSSSFSSFSTSSSSSSSSPFGPHSSAFSPSSPSSPSSSLPTLLLPRLKSIKSDPFPLIDPLSNPSSINLNITSSRTSSSSSSSFHSHSYQQPSSHPTLLHSSKRMTSSSATTSTTNTMTSPSPSSSSTSTSSSATLPSTKSLSNPPPHVPMSSSSTSTPSTSSLSHTVEDPRTSMALKQVQPRSSMPLDLINAPDRSSTYLPRSPDVDVIYQHLTSLQSDQIDATYTVKVQHEVLVRPEETTAQACLLDLIKQVSLFLQSKEEDVLLVLQTGKWLPQEFNIHPNMQFHSIEHLAERLLSLWNEFMFTTRPLTQSRTTYIKPSMALEHPWKVFLLFSHLNQLNEHQAIVLVKRCAVPLEEWVGLRNALVLLNERARCTKEIKF